MLNNLIFSLNATLPVFLLMLFGMLLRKVGFISEDFAGKLNDFVFKVSIPFLLFYDTTRENFLSYFDGRYVLFCFIATAAEISVSVILSRFLKDKSERGEFIQACFRSSAALLGVVFMENIYNDTRVLPLMVLGAVPLYNISAVIILELYKPGSAGDTDSDAGKGRRKPDPALIRSTLFGILKNPVIIGIVCGLLWSLLSLPLPAVADKTIGYVADTASPLGLIALGAQFDIHAAVKDLKPTLAASFMKLTGFAALIIPVAVHMGFLREKLVALIIMAGSPTTVTAFVMAKGFGHKGVLSASSVMLTTLMSSFSMTLWIFLCMSAGWL